MIEDKEKLIVKNRELDSNNHLLTEKLKEKNKEIKKLKDKIKKLESDSEQIEGQTSIFDFID